MIIEGILLIYSKQRLNFESKQKLIYIFTEDAKGLLSELNGDAIWKQVIKQR
jgi:hypothetical protein